MRIRDGIVAERDGGREQTPLLQTRELGCGGVGRREWGGETRHTFCKQEGLVMDKRGWEERKGGRGVGVACDGRGQAGSRKDTGSRSDGAAGHGHTFAGQGQGL